MDGPSPRVLQTLLLDWFDAGHRDMPWRRTRDPYRILLAEYLLQRTRVVSGTPYYERFLKRFPDIASLAAAPEEDVLRAWEGLGFYRRARNLHAAARAIVRDHGGRIPSDAATLATLPGIGPYTAGAVASIAFGEPVPAIDGNVVRVLTRVFGIEDDVTRQRGRGSVEEVARSLVPTGRPGAFNQALMELGATVCTPRRPRCAACPLGSLCVARREGVPESLPRMPKKSVPTAADVAFAYIRSRGLVLLVRRPDRDLLGGLWALPGGEVASPKNVARSLRDLVVAQTGVRVEVGEEVARIAHTFSHRRWSGPIVRCSVRGRGTPSANARWVSADDARHLPVVPRHRKLLEELAARRPLESFVESPIRRRQGPRRSRTG